MRLRTNNRRSIKNGKTIGNRIEGGVDNLRPVTTRDGGANLE